MNRSSLLFITCDELREEFTKCPNDINKRILIIDVRHATLYNRSHLCLDTRHNIDSIRRKMRVMNIDPDSMNVCILKNILNSLNEDDRRIFMNRRDATDVVIVDRNTDDINELASPKSKVMRLINGLTKYDPQEESKIIVPMKVLQGGYREWLLKYPHFTTDSKFDPDSQVSDYDDMRQKPAIKNHTMQPSSVENGLKSTSPIIEPNSPASPLIPRRPPPQPQSKPSLIIQPKILEPAISIPTAQRPGPLNPIKPVKNAPGTAVPVIPSLLPKPTLPRSHSSPNVAQADGDEPENKFTQTNGHVPNKTVSVISPDAIHGRVDSSALPITPKPRFDRTLKPAFNSEALNLIRAKLNFGRSPEASERTITGLQNLGNTCFMNSVIQCLAYEPALVSYFCSDQYYNHINFSSQYGSSGELAVEFGELIEKLNSQRYRYIEPRSFRESITKHIGFVGNEQQDSHEFMMMLFDKLHHDLNVHAKDKFRQNGLHNGKSNSDDNNVNIPRATLGYQFWKRHLELNKSIISDLFEGIFMSTLTCTFCKGQSNTFEVFNCLSLPIPSETRCHLRDCLNHFSNPERIEAAWECPICKQKREADKKIVICKLPKVLIIHLKRFSLDGRWRQKLQTTVDFPLNGLTVDCNNVLPQSAYGPMGARTSYNLRAVVNHFGHLDGGHYTAFGKIDKQRWFTFDDSNVSEMRDADVCSQAAYILFYGSDY